MSLSQASPAWDIFLSFDFGYADCIISAMFETYRNLRHKYPKISLYQERRLIKQAQGRSKKKKNELVERHVWFVIFRINNIVFPTYRARFGEEMLSQAIFILYAKIKTYNLRYKDKKGNSKPVRFSSYIWKRIDGFIIDYLKNELNKEEININSRNVK